MTTSTKKHDGSELRMRTGEAVSIVNVGGETFVGIFSPDDEHFISSYLFIKEAKSSGFKYFIMDTTDTKRFESFGETKKLCLGTPDTVKMMGSLSGFMELHEKRVYMRQIPCPTQPKIGNGYFTDDVLEIIIMVLKQQGDPIGEDDTRLNPYHEQWTAQPAQLTRIIPHSDFEKILEEFDVKKDLITVFLDIDYQHSLIKRKMSGNHFVGAINRDGNEVMYPNEATWQVFQQCVCGINWQKRKNSDCMSEILELMTEFSEISETFMIHKSYIDQKIAVIKLNGIYSDQEELHKTDCFLESHESHQSVPLDQFESLVDSFDLPSFTFLDNLKRDGFNAIEVDMFRALASIGWLQQFFGPGTSKLKELFFNCVGIFLPADRWEKLRNSVGVYVINKEFTVGNLGWRVNRVLEEIIGGRTGNEDPKIKKMREDAERRKQTVKKQKAGKKTNPNPTPNSKTLLINRLATCLEGLKKNPKIEDRDSDVLDNVKYSTNHHTMNEETILKLKPNYFFINRTRLDKFLQFTPHRLQLHDDFMTRETYMKYDNEEFVMRVIHYGSYDKHVFTDEVLENISLALKTRGTLTKGRIEKLKKLSAEWDTKDPDLCNSIPLLRFMELLKEFEVDESLITHFLDGQQEKRIKETLEKTLRSVWVMSSTSHAVMSREHVIFFIFQSTVCGRNWPVGEEKSEQMVVFKENLMRVLNEYMDIKDGVHVVKTKVDSHILQLTREIEAGRLAEPVPNYFCEKTAHTDIVPLQLIKEDRGGIRKYVEQQPAWFARFSYIQNVVSLFFGDEFPDLKLEIVKGLRFKIPAELGKKEFSKWKENISLQAEIVKPASESMRLNEFMLRAQKGALPKSFDGKRLLVDLERDFKVQDAATRRNVIDFLLEAFPKYKGELREELTGVIGGLQYFHEEEEAAGNVSFKNALENEEKTKKERKKLIRAAVMEQLRVMMVKHFTSVEETAELPTDKEQDSQVVETAPAAEPGPPGTSDPVESPNEAPEPSEPSEPSVNSSKKTAKPKNPYANNTPEELVRIIEKKTRKTNYLETEMKKMELDMQLLKEKMKNANKARKDEQDARITAEKEAAKNKDKADKHTSVASRLHERELQLEQRDKEIEKLKLISEKNELLENEFKSLKEKMKKMEKDMATSSKEKLQLEKKNSELQKSVNELTTKTHTQFEERVHLEELIARRNQEFSLKNRAYSKLEKEIEIMTRKVNDLEDENMEFRNSAPGPSSQSEILKLNRKKLMELRKMKDDFGKNKLMEEANEMMEKLKSLPIDPDSLETAESELLQLESFIENYKDILDLNARIFQKTNNPSKLLQLPEYPKISDEFMDIYSNSFPIVPPTTGIPDADCLICHVYREPDQEVQGCTHCPYIYHLECIKKWFKEKSTCPQCQQILRDPQEYPELK